MKFENLGLHDATIKAISYLWEDKTLTINGKCYSEKIDGFVDFTLRFNAVTCVSIPHQEKWGTSSSINGTRLTTPKKYSIEIQSGDEIAIEAEDFKFNA